MADKAKSAFLVFIDDSKDGINNQTLEDVEKQIADNRADDLYLIIESGGGSPFSAVAIMNILQSHFNKIHTIVPKNAKSAATLMALGTDDIYMQERSALGPLDLPIEHYKDGSRISALDVVNTTTAMAALGDSIAKDKYSFFRERGLSKRDAAQLAMDNATEFLKPIVEQVDPYHLQKAHRELRIGTWYAIDMLASRMMRGNIPKAGETVQKLVNKFPAHEYSIYSEDAEHMLGLTIHKMADLGVWNDNLKARYQKVCHKPYHIEFGIIESNEATATSPIKAASALKPKTSSKRK